MSKLKLLSAVVVCAGLAACQTTTVSKDTHYTASQDARIRLYGQNQKPTIMTYEQAGKTVKINVGGGAGDAFSSMVGTIKNSSIGIAATATSTSFQEKNSILSKAFYKEFSIPAGQPIKVHNSFIGLTNVSQSPEQTTVQYQGSCHGSEMVFTPVAGKDYEVVANAKGATCGVTVLEIDTAGNTRTVVVK